MSFSRWRRRSGVVRFFGSEFFAGEGVLRDEGLHDVAVAPLNKSAGFVHLFVGVEGLDNGGSEFMVDATAHDELDGFFNFFSAVSGVFPRFR